MDAIDRHAKEESIVIFPIWINLKQKLIREQKKKQRSRHNTTAQRTLVCRRAAIACGILLQTSRIFASPMPHFLFKPFADSCCVVHRQPTSKQSGKSLFAISFLSCRSTQTTDKGRGWTPCSPMKFFSLDDSFHLFQLSFLQAAERPSSKNCWTANGRMEVVAMVD